MKRWLRFKLAVPAVVSLMIACNWSSDEPHGGSRRDGILNGTEPAGDPAALGFVFLTKNFAGPVLGTGTGTFVADDWVLTADHVTAFTHPERVRAYLGGLAGDHRQASRIVSHPSERETTDQLQIDVALVKLASKFAVPVGIHNISSLPTNSITDIVHWVECYGYGSTVIDAAHQDLGALHYGAPFEAAPRFPADAASVDYRPDKFIVWTTPDGQAPYSGDSGGPCIPSPSAPTNNDIFGVMLSVDGNVGDTPTGGRIAAAAAFKTWADLIMSSVVSANGDINGDGVRDTFALVESNGWLYPSVYLGAHPWSNSTILTSPLPIAPAGVVPPFLVLGDFNADGVDDVFIDVLDGINDVPYCFNGVVGDPAQVFNAIPCLFQTLPYSYKGFSQSGDTDGDGAADVEALTSDGHVDVYYGRPASSETAGGLTSGVQMNGFPSADSGDGRFLDLTASQLQTVVFTSMYLNIYSADQSDVRIEVFDGDIGGLNENDNKVAPDGRITVACYALQSCGTDDDATCSSPSVWSDAYFRDADNAWKSIYHDSGPQPYRYKLQITIGACVAANCQNPCDANGRPFDTVPVPLTENMFKVRSNAPLGTDSPVWAFAAAGLAPPTAVWGHPNYVDTSYDGTFDFPLWLGTAPESVYFTDCDADFELDGTLDPTDSDQNPALAAGQNSLINYALAWFDSSNQPVSQFPDTTIDPKAVYMGSMGVNWYLDPSGGMECEEHHVSAVGKDGWWDWAWNGVYTINTVELKWVTGTANTRPYLFMMDRSKRGRPSPSCARPVSYWEANPTLVASDLPLTLGSDLTISDPQVAARVLAGLSALPTSRGSTESWLNALEHGKVTVCHKASEITIAAPALNAHLAHGDDATTPKAMANLAAQLLAAKLNLRLASSLGESLSRAAIYARDETVADIIAEADALIDGIDGICGLTTAQVERMAWLTRRLSTINAGDVTYAAAPPPHSSLSSPLAVPQQGSGQNSVLMAK